MYIIIVGCGRVGSELAQLLSAEGHNVVIVDRSPASFERLGNTFNGLTFVGNGFSLELLRQAGIEKADAFCAVTNGDNTNLISAQVARKIFNVPKVIARIYDPRRANIYSALGLDILSGTILFASMIRDKIVESRFSSYLIESKDVGVLEVEVKDDLAGKTIADINIPGEFMVVAVRRLAGVTIPEPKTAVMKKDVLMAVVKVDVLEKIKKKLNLAGG
ncbi:MAG: TrkA family potassium uptake protein [Candidatus Omnitrophica bacterium]|nr:TrkA family potassium uptake protein [Candidatus Omnitrophota bacterium]MDD4940981.1 TrkA family potassium uptake protein [Candidatus Omnitrophota bacterium]MDD5775074.1 TrkA family potassium uptake protein [Candidatus Omnitrophota bacterium]HNQ49977.1 TrkA family potassium uptake protein [Candidatus Omnitrophota bacterium]HQO37369.1 TrkA family potassium uptake protein [Candidatus Omnitrophota bacterium]